MLTFGYVKMMFAVSPSLDWKSHSSLQSPVLALKFLFQQLECPVLQLSDTGCTTASSENIKTSLLEIHHVTQPWITLVSFTAASIISSSAYRKISWYWHLPAYNHVILMGTSCPLSKSPQLKQLNSSCTTQSSFLRPFYFKVNYNEVGSTTDPRGALKIKQWGRNENHANYKWNCRGESKSPAAIFSSFFVYCYCSHNLL